MCPSICEPGTIRPGKMKAGLAAIGGVGAENHVCFCTMPHRTVARQPCVLTLWRARLCPVQSVAHVCVYLSVQNLCPNRNRLAGAARSALEKPCKQTPLDGFLVSPFPEIKTTSSPSPCVGVGSGEERFSCCSFDIFVARIRGGGPAGSGGFGGFSRHQTQG